MDKLWQVWIKLRSSLWLVPGIILAVAILLALILVEVDAQVSREWLITYPTLFGLGADGSRGMLTAIGSSMLTVAALTFSLTLAALAQASSQFTPRVLRLFLRDRLNQFVLGYFVSVYAYCLIVLRTIRSGDGEEKFVPGIAVVFGLLTALGGIVVLIYFIHHIAESLQVSNILNNVVRETLDSINRVFPEELGEAAPEEKREKALSLSEAEEWLKVPALKGGYIQSVNSDKLLDFAEENKLAMEMKRGVGDFILKDNTLVSIVFDDGNIAALDEKLIEKINDLFSISHYRTIEQDVDFGIQQIIDIALKALSPGVNDTTTAVSSIDYLGIILSKIARRRLPVKERLSDGRVRLIASAPTFENYVEKSFDSIRSNAADNYQIYERLLDTISKIYENTARDDRRAVLRGQVELIAEYSDKNLKNDYEKRKVNEKIKKIVELFYSAV